MPTTAACLPECAETPSPTIDADASDELDGSVRGQVLRPRLPYCQSTEPTALAAGNRVAPLTAAVGIEQEATERAENSIVLGCLRLDDRASSPVDAQESSNAELGILDRNGRHANFVSSVPSCSLHWP